MKKISIFYHSDCLLHINNIDHPERKERLEVIIRAIKEIKNIKIQFNEAPLANFGGLSGVVYASGFLSPTETDSAFTLVLATPSGYVVELPAAASALALDDIISSVPGEFYVQQNYPNPFNPTTTIRYDLMNDSALRITVYDVQGKLINELYDGFQSAGRNSIIWDATNGVGETVSSGVYLYKIQAGDSYQVKRMMFLK